MGVKAESSSKKAGVSGPDLGITTTWLGILMFFCFFLTFLDSLKFHTAPVLPSWSSLCAVGALAMTPLSLSSSVGFALCAPTLVTSHAARSPNIKDVRDALTAPRFPFFKKKRTPDA